MSRGDRAVIAAWGRREPDARIAVALAVIAAIPVILFPPQLTLALAIIALLAALGWARPGIGLGVIAVTIPLQEAITLSVGPGTTTLTRLALVPFIVGWLIRWMMQHAEIKLTPPVVAWFLVVSALIVSIPAAADRFAWSEEVYRWAAAFALYVVACDSMKTARSCRPVIVGASMGVALCVVVAAWQTVTAAGPASFQANGLTRVYAFFGEPNPLAGYLEMTLPLLVALVLPWFLSGGSIHGLFGAWGMAALTLLAVGGGVALLLTQSRGGYLGISASLMLVGLLSGRRARNLTLIGIIVVSVMILVTPPGRNAADRFASSLTAIGGEEQVTVDNWSVQERIAHWKAGLHMLRDQPWSGVGAGNFNGNYRENTEVWRFRIPRGHAHNNEIQMGAQSGYTGLIAYLVLLFSVGARIVRGLRGQSPPTSHALAVGALGVLLAVVVHGQFDYLHGLSLNLAFALALACAEPAASFTPDAHARLVAS
jgi:O-antigen ligase